MRLWTIHPRYLDAKGLVAAWREGLLAQKVLQGRTCGYRNHPQLSRFRSHASPLTAIGAFLRGLAHEARQRGYRFDTGKISRARDVGQIEETRGQLLYEWQHFLTKLRRRSPGLYHQFKDTACPEAHPLFHLIPGGVRHWEKQAPRFAEARKTITNRRLDKG